MPLLCKKEATAEDTEGYGDLTWAKNKLLLTAIKKIKEETNEENELAALELINEYTLSFQRNLSGHQTDEQQAEYYNQKTNEARLLAINLQRKYISNLLSNGEIDITVFDAMSKFLNYREEALDDDFRFGTMFFLKQITRYLGRLFVKTHKNASAGLHLVRDIQMRAMEAAIAGLEEYAKTQEKPEYVYAVLLDYEKMLKRLKHSGDSYNDMLEEKKEKLRFEVMDAERSEIHRMYEDGEITSEQEKELRRFTNYIESIVLYEHNE